MKLMRSGFAARRVAAVLIAMLAGIGLTACERKATDQQPKTLGQNVDAAVAESRNALDKAGDKIDSAASTSADEAKRLAGEAGDKMRDAGSDASRLAGDSRITAEVKAALARDPDIKARDIKVETDVGRVKLEGEVDSAAARAKAEEIAATTAGVKGVDSQLVVRLGKSS